MVEYNNSLSATVWTPVSYRIWVDSFSGRMSQKAPKPYFRFTRFSSVYVSSFLSVLFRLLCRNLVAVRYGLLVPAKRFVGQTSG